MLTVHLRRFLSVHQRQFVPLLIAVGAGTLSLRLTVHACWGLSPTGSALDVAALGTLCEVAKLSFGPRALLGFANATQPWARVGYLSVGALVLSLMVFSVGATFAFTVRTEAQGLAAGNTRRAQALAESDEYKALSKEIETFDTRIGRLLDDADILRAANKPTKAGEKDAIVAEVQAQRIGAATRRAALRANTLPSDDAGKEIAHWVHLAVAVALELVGVAASVLVHTGRSSVPTAGAVKVQDTDSDSGTVVCIDTARKLADSRASNAGPAGVGKRFTARYLQARELIESGAIRPTLDALARSVRVSQRPAKRILEALCADGVIQWNGRRYERCTSVTTSVSLAA